MTIAQHRYELETGQKAMYRKDGADYHTLRYVRWLEKVINQHNLFELNMPLLPKSYGNDSGINQGIGLAILEKLEEIRCGIIDVESAINPR